MSSLAAADRNVPGRPLPNKASNELSRSVQQIDYALSKLNLGITTWERVRGQDDDNYGDYWSEDVGYARVGRKWGLALRRREGNHADMEVRDLEEWLFDDAPKSMRIEAIKHLPALVTKLIKAADKTRRKLEETSRQAELLASSVNEVRESLKPAPKKLIKGAPPMSPESGVTYVSGRTATTLRSLASRQIRSTVAKP